MTTMEWNGYWGEIQADLALSGNLQDPTKSQKGHVSLDSVKGILPNHTIYSQRSFQGMHFHKWPLWWSESHKHRPQSPPEKTGRKCGPVKQTHKILADQKVRRPIMSATFVDYFHSIHINFLNARLHVTDVDDCSCIHLNLIQCWVQNLWK